MTVIAKVSARVAESRVPVIEGQPYDDDDPIVKAHPGLFESPEAAATRKFTPKSTVDLGDRSMTARHIRVEQTSAAPGEARSVDLACKVDGCDFEGKSPAGLAKHSKVHRG